MGFVAIFSAARGAVQPHMLLGSLSPFTTNGFDACGTADRASQLGLIGATFVFDGQAQCSIPVRVHRSGLRSSMKRRWGWGRGAERSQPRHGTNLV